MSVFGDFERPNADRPPMLDPTILDPSILDLVLKQGSAEQRAAFHQELGENPLLAMEVAETVALLEQFRLLTVEPSRQYESKLNQVVRQAAERLERRRSTPWWPRLLVVAAAAAITVSLLGWADPLGVGAGLAPRQQLDAAAPLLHRDGTRLPSVASNGGLLAGDDRGFLANADALRKRLAVLDAPPAVRAEFEAALLPAADPLGRWLDPQNALAVLRSDHEHRSDSLVARAAASREFALRAAQDVRVQQLADSLAAEICERLAAPREGGAGSRALPETAEVALAVRACLGAGATSESRHHALVLGSDWLAERADQMPCAEQVQALSALVEVAATLGRHNDVVVRVGERLLDGVLLANDDTWGRRLPELLGNRVATASLADAGRLLAFLPGLVCRQNVAPWCGDCCSANCASAATATRGPKRSPGWCSASPTCSAKRSLSSASDSCGVGSRRAWHRTSRPCITSPGGWSRAVSATHACAENCGGSRWSPNRWPWRRGRRCA